MAKSNRPKTGLHGQALRDFRHQVSLARKKGLVSARVDARKQKPTRYMRTKIKKLAPVFEGTSAAVKVPPKMARQYRKAGFSVFGNAVVVAAEPGEIASIKKGMPLMRRRLGGDFWEERLVLPITVHNLSEIEADLEARSAYYNSLKDPDELFAFKLFGANSLATFEDFELMLEYLSHYQVFETNDEPETWESINFYRVARGHWQPTPKKPYKRRRYSSPDRREAPRRLKPDYMRKQEDAERKRRQRNNPDFRASERDKDRAYQAARRAREKQAKLDRENGWT